jgi:hypothetical protein
MDQQFGSNKFGNGSLHNGLHRIANGFLGIRQAYLKME